MQTMYSMHEGNILELKIPPPETQLLDGVLWGSFDALLTPAYWKGQAWQHEQLGTYNDSRLGSSLTEETAACLLGGYGMPAELGIAAYKRLRDRGMIASIPTVVEVENALSEPFLTRHGVPRHFRFRRTKARYLVASLRALQYVDPGHSDVALRDQLLELPGIGPKTASWIVRNHRSSDKVAIIDVHILRAGRHTGLFPMSWQPERHYSKLESAFIDFATALGVRTSILDALIWDYMRRLTSAKTFSPKGSTKSAF